MEVSVAMTAYNHEEFIAQAIESALMQEVNFDYEVVIGEDCSPDRTGEIVREYQKEYPHRIRVLPRRRNLGRPYNFVDTLRSCSGQYVALLQGDDYWTSPHKLQKQVDLLEANPDFVTCYHPVGWLDQESGEITHWQHGTLSVKRKPYYTLDDLLECSNFMPTCSVIFRNRLFVEFPDWYYRAGVADFPLHILNALHGKIGFLDEPMAVYRRHKGGVHGGNTPTQNLRRAIETYSLIGTNLHLDKRSSYRIGLSNYHVELCKAYKQQGSRVKALLAGYEALKVAPQHWRTKTLPRVILTVFPRLHRLADLARKSFRVLTRQGLAELLTI